MAPVLHGLIQRAKLDAETLPFKSYPGGKGFRMWTKTESGWICIGELSSLDHAVDFMVGKLSQEER